MAKRNRKYDEVSYWESLADSMIALLLMILLIVMLLIMYLVRIPDEDFVDLYRGDQYEEYADPEQGGGNHAYGEIDDELGEQWDEEENPQGSGGDVGGSGGDHGEEDDDGEFDDPDPGAGEGEGTDRAAVLVQVVDGETGRTIKLKGIEFELYGANSALQVLSTYYPKKIDYKQYETDETGVFYLPEKVVLGGYYLHQLSGLPGYDTSENVAFDADRAYDWSDPLVVTVSLFPARDIIRVQLRDRDDGGPVGGASFEVLAAEDIVTQDGTTRYKKGDIVDVLTVDDNGYGESNALFLGEYSLRQRDVPELYARIATETKVRIEDRAENDAGVITQLTARKTTMRVQLCDALYDTIYIKDAKFKVTLENGTLVDQPVTDDKGRFSLTNLKKNTTYHITQETTIGDYRMDTTDYSISVNGDGMINGSAEGMLLIKNGMIRVSVGVRDRLFRGQVSDISVAVKDANGVVVKTWYTTGLEQVITGLNPGEYQVMLRGREDEENRINVKDTAELQVFQFDEWTTADIGAIFSLAVFAAGMVAVMTIVIRRRRMARAENGSE